MGSVCGLTFIIWQLELLLENLQSLDPYTVYGSYLEGRSIYEEELAPSGMLVFGNESKGHSSLAEGLLSVSP